MSVTGIAGTYNYNKIPVSSAVFIQGICTSAEKK